MSSREAPRNFPLNFRRVRKVTSSVFSRRFTVACLVALVPCAFAQTPSIHYCLPGAVAPGAATELTLHGSNLAGARELWISFDAKAEAVRSGPDKAVFRVTVPADAPVGIHAARVISAGGVSSLHLLMVDDLPSVAAHGTNRAMHAAQEVKPPAAIDGVCEPLKMDCYRFKARKDQRLSVEVVARRMGSALDPVIRLFDSQGRALAFNDDAEGLGADSRFSHRFAAAGEYIIEVCDARYEGGAKHRYRLRLGDFPLVTTPFPLAVKGGGETTVEFLGREPEGVATRRLKVSEREGRVSLTVRARQGEGAAFAGVVVTGFPEVVEREPNDTPELANAISPPCAVNGRFAKPADTDVYSFDARKGEKWWFAGQTRSLGAPSEVFLRLLDPEGKQIAEANGTDADEGSLTNTFNADGRFRLVVEELARRGGPDHAYRVEVRRYAGFELSVETERLEMAPGGSVDLKVTAARRDYNGPITLALAGEAKGLALEDGTIAEKKNETTLKIKAPTDCAGGRWLHIGLIGTAKIDDREASARVTTRPALRKLWPDLRYPPHELDDLIALWVKPAEK